MYIIVEHPDVAARCINFDLDIIFDWACKWLVKFSPPKTDSMLLSRKINKPYHPPLFMSNVQIKEVTSHKHLGIHLSSDCTWHTHIGYIKEKAWQRLNVMRRLKFILDRRSLEIVYTSFIRPLLEYGDTIWDNCTLYEKQELDKIQNEAAEKRPVPRHWSLFKIYIMKWDGKACKQEEQIINWLYFLKCNTI